MKLTVIEAWLLLLYFEVIMRRRDLRALNETVRRFPVSPARSPTALSCAGLSRSMDLASVLFFKQVKCLQRSAATTLLLRCHGWEAEMITGAQVLPFRAHAWVEVHGVVVNDKQHMREIYEVLERC